VTVTKRLFCVALFLAAFFIVTVPALAWNGARQDYTTSDGCQVCHQSGQPSAAPKVFNAWAATKHGTDSEAANAAKSIPAGSVCAGCHTANFDPTKSSPVPTATTYAFNTALPTPVATKTTVAWGASPSTVASPQALGNGSFSELDIGCSSCHYGASVPGSLSDTGNDVNDTAHTAPYTDLANAEICGACHSRFSYTVNTYTVNPIPSPTASQTTLIQPQMAIGYPMLGVNYQPLSNFLNVAAPGWQPTPNPSATGTAFGQLQTYWTVDGTPTKWQETGHDGSAAQYPEWNSEKHAAALTNLKKAVGSNPPAACLQCHSTDYRIAANDAKPTGTQAKYGVTCVACHAPHDAGTAKGVWSDEYDAQLVGNPANSSDVCTQCHTEQAFTGESPSPVATGLPAAGTLVRYNTTEVMNGTGAIGVPQGLPGVHDQKCVDCHMPPTSFSRGSAQLGGNHTFEIITPKDANDASPVPVVTSAATSTPTATTSPWASPTPIVTTYIDESTMPYSACSTCHNNNVNSTATPQPILTTTPSPQPVGKIAVTVTRVMQNQGDKALWLQDTLDQRQASMHAQYDAVTSALHAAGLRMGFIQPVASPAKGVSVDQSYVTWLNGVLNGLGAPSWNTAEVLWQDGYTDWTYVAGEGSWGIHNWQYDSLVIQAALNFANRVDTTKQVVTLKAYKSLLLLNAIDIFSGTVTPATKGTITIQRKSSGNWLAWKTVTVGSTGHFSIKVKMTKKGTYYLRAFYPAKPPYAGGISAQIKVVVK